MLRWIATTIGAWIALNRRWLIATGAVVLAVVAMEICVPARAADGGRGIDRIERTSDSIARVVQPAIQRERASADSAGRVERAAAARVARLRGVRSAPGVASYDSTAAQMDAILAAEDTALAAADVRASAFETALDLSEVRAHTADSLLKVAVKASGGAEQCRWLGVLPCMSRRAILVDVAAALVLRKVL